jgi:peptidyl-prolyl cis-trans isomerase D
VEQLNNIVYEQSSSLQPAAEKLGLPIQQSPWITQGNATTQLANPKLQAEIFSDSSIKGKRNTSAIEVAPNTFIAAHVLEHKAAELRPLDAVRGEIDRKLQRDEAMRLAREDGEAKLKSLQEGKDTDLKWPAPLGVNRQRRAAPPQVLDKAFRADPKKLPAYAGIETLAATPRARVEVVELEKVEDAQRQALAGRLRQAVADEELESTLTSVRDRVGVAVKKGALDVRRDEAPVQQAPAPQPRGKF